MLLFPKKPKYIKSFSRKNKHNFYNEKQSSSRFSYLVLMSNESGYIPNFQIEALRLFLRRALKKRCQLFFRIFPSQSITKKPNETRNLIIYKK